MLKRRPFILPSIPVPRPSPPSGQEWIHEVKFDGWRVQLVKVDQKAFVFSRNGTDFTKRFRQLTISLVSIPYVSAIIDAEVVVCASDGAPDFNALMSGQTDNLCAWCFDIMELDGFDLRPLSLIKRKTVLRDLLIEADDDMLRYSDEFEDAKQLLKLAEKMGLEGIVSKKVNQPYKSGRNLGWVKVKTAQWRKANKDRGECQEVGGLPISAPPMIRQRTIG